MSPWTHNCLFVDGSLCTPYKSSWSQKTIFTHMAGSNARGSFFLFCSVLLQCVRWFRFGFSDKPKSRCPLFFFSHLRPNVSQPRRLGAIRAQLWSYSTCPTGFIPFLRNKFPDFSRTQIDFSRALNFSLTPTILRSQY